MKIVRAFFVITAFILTVGCEKDPDKLIDQEDSESSHFRPCDNNSSKWISKVLEYNPAPGQFINKSPGMPADCEGIIGKKGMVTLGAFGGSVTFQFDHSVMNQKGYDFVIHGNAFIGNSEPGIVLVSIDENGNGIADDEWYELYGENHSLKETTPDYEVVFERPDDITRAVDIAWTDNLGKKGLFEVAPTLPFHRQTYWPLFTAEEKASLTFKGTRLANLNMKDDNGKWINQEAGKGYCDNFSDDYAESVNNDADTKYSNKFDISNAINKNGEFINLKGIDFIKVYTCVHQYSGPLGETSTEVCGAISLTCKK